MNTEWTTNGVKSMITNPVYTGMGPYPPTIELERWLNANVRMIAEEGPQFVIESVIQHFQDIFPCFPTPDAAPYILLAASGPKTALRILLTDLNRILETSPVFCPLDTREEMTDEQAVESFLQIIAQIAKRLVDQDDTVEQ